MSEEGRPRVFLVDDHAVVRAGVRAELGAAVTVVGEADEVDAAVEMINERVPDVVLLDVHLPGGGGQAVIAGVMPHNPQVQFLALSVSDAPEDVIAVIRAGARGYITKTVSGEELLDAVYQVAAGDAVFSPRLAGFVLDAFAGTAGRSDGGDRPRSRAGPALPARARSAAPDRPWLHLQGGGPRPDHFRQDRGVACLLGPPEAAAVDPTRAGQVGHRPAARIGGDAAVTGCADLGQLNLEFARNYRSCPIIVEPGYRSQTIIWPIFQK